MSLFGTRIKDKDLLEIVVVLKDIQKIRDGIDSDPAVQSEGYNHPSGTRKDTYSEVVRNILKERTRASKSKLDALIKKLK